MGWDFFVDQGQDSFDHPGYPGCRFQVSDIGLYGTNGHGTSSATVVQDSIQRMYLNRVTQRRAGSVGLNIADISRLYARAGKSLANDGLLGQAAGCSQAVGTAVLIDCRTTKYSQDWVSISLGVRQALQHNHAAPLPANIAVGAGVERFATAVSSHHACLGKSNS